MSSFVESAVSTWAARAKAWAATAWAKPESQGARPPPKSKSYSKPTPPPGSGTPRAASAFASSVVAVTFLLKAAAFSAPKFASGWNSNPPWKYR